MSDWGWIALGTWLWLLYAFRTVSKQVRNLHQEVREFRARFDGLFPLSRAGDDLD